MNILSLDHAALLVQDINKSRQFYTTVLGLHEIPSNGNCWLTNGRIQVHLLEAGAPFKTANYSEEELKDGHTTHIAFRVDDLEEVRLHLKTHDIPIVCGPRPRWPSGEQLYFCDPDGYVIEVFIEEEARMTDTDKLRNDRQIRHALKALRVDKHTERFTAEACRLSALFGQGQTIAQALMTVSDRQLQQELTPFMYCVELSALVNAARELHMLTPEQANDFHMFLKSIAGIMERL